MLIKRLLLNDRGGAIVLALIAAAMVIIPILNLAVPASSAFHVSTFTVTLVGKFLCYALLALSIDLIWGYCGILSLGQGAFFTLGGYAMGMYLMRQIGARGQYGNPELPDFMVFLNWDHLPWYWLGFDSFVFAMLMVIVVPGLLAFIFGWLAFRSRVTGVYFSIITQALTYALMLAFFRNEMGFGGNNGLTDFKDILGQPIAADTTRIALFLSSGIALIAAYIACRYIVTSRFGRIVISIRDAESRTRFCGYKVESYKLWIFVFSSILAGIAGALYVPQVGIINPGEFSPLNSIELVVWVATGGRGTLFGAIVGAFTVNYGKTLFTSFSPETWLFALGALFVIVTLVLPKGLVGLFNRPKKSESAHESIEDDIVTIETKTAGGKIIMNILAHAKQALPIKDPDFSIAPTGFGKDVDNFGAPLDTSKRTVLYVEGITVSFDGFRALNNLNLYVDDGELRCIIGPNGAGKTTMMDVITGKTKPDAGSVYFGQQINLLELSEHQIARGGIGRKFQKPTIFEALTVYENLELATASNKAVWWTLTKSLNGDQKFRIDEVLIQIGLKELRYKNAGALSHGQKQWLEIGMLLMQSPRVLLVDEPVAGMTGEETEKTAELLLSLAGKHSVIVVEHDMKFVRSIARKVTVLHQGSVLTEGTMDQVQNDPKVIEVYLGE